MRQWICLGLALFSASCFGSVTKLSVKSDNGLSGSATLTNKVLNDGSKYVQLSMELKNSSGQKVVVIQESSYDSNGKPVRKLQTTNLGSAETKQSVQVSFDSKGAQVKIVAGGKTATETVAYPSGKSLLAKPEFWFVRDKPAPGAVTTYWRFDLGTQSWVETKTTYHGKREITVGGKKVSAHLTEYAGAKAYLDDNGDPYRIEMGATVMERTG